ncbi:hypothetical protein BCR33DRAFT_166199 [Rhizoclosmatium globosum]|uniref:Uncharacterized protein n=1 Tax=Rhizoclosmatium globosum TaxID=329046 RepID=A0A1Y2AHW3_9FUNG|nr:hypothetical protein BCR33DRAFT_166199 [Rhizoclosmatium globosum]|eukprot:ORY22044.1 hypothetical protein BCR33DRAFT_166199 [Rhizoclosmatium globosum]
MQYCPFRPSRCLFPFPQSLISTNTINHQRKTENLDAIFLAALNQDSEQLDSIHEPDKPDDFDAATPREKGIRNMTRRIESEINTDDSSSFSSDSSDSDDDPAYLSSVLPPNIPWKALFASSLFPPNPP